MRTVCFRSVAPILGMLAGACSPLGAFNAAMPKDGAARLAASGVQYSEGPRRRLDVYVPRRTADARPVIVFFYGGSWNSGDRRGYGFVGKALAARGFVTVIPDYRLVPEVTYPGFVEDAAAAVRWVRATAKAYGGDGERIVLAGHSAGAYIAAMLAVDARWLGKDRAAVRGLAGLAGPYDLAPFDVASSQAAFGRWPNAAETQPVTHADASAPPALLLTGADDTLVRSRNSEALAAKLREAGVAAELKLYPDVAHIGILTAIAKPFRGKAPVVADVADFAERVTK